MSVRLAPSGLPGESLAPYGRAPNPSEWPAVPQGGGVPWARYIDVVKRQFGLIAFVALAGSGIGFLVARRVKPVYEAQVKIWIDPGGSVQSGPIRSGQLLPAPSWNELLVSYATVEPVVRRLRLNVSYKRPADSVLFAKFETLPSLHPGL